MEPEQAAHLQAGDRVYWNDPDEDLCSDYYQVVEVEGESLPIVYLGDPVTGEILLEAYPQDCELIEEDQR